MAIAQIGPLTGLLEGIATAVGAGILLGSFTMGVYGLAFGRPRQDLEERVLTDGYFGGLLGIGVVLLDVVLRYG